LSAHSGECRFAIAPFALTVARPASTDLDAFKASLTEKLALGGKFLRHAPLVIDLDALDATVEIGALAESARCAGFRVAGLATRDPDAYADQAEANGISIIGGAGKLKPTAQQQRSTTLLVDHTVRSGQQIFARDGDLVVTAGVNAGGEVAARGCIHIYGNLRGRAIAGADGDERARIFCTCLQAELVSIAGTYRVLDGEDASCYGNPAEIRLCDGSLKITKR